MWSTLFLVVFFVSLCSGQSVLCNVCQLVVSVTEKYIANNATEQEIIQALAALCNQIPVVGPECVQVVANYTPQLINWILTKENPQQFCSQVGLCSSTNAVVLKPKMEKRSEEQGACAICQMVMTYIEQFVAQNSTEQSIITQLQSFRSILGPLQSECSSFVATYTPQAIEWIEKQEPPAAFCQQVGLCTSTLNRDLKQRKHFSLKFPKVTQMEKRETSEEEQGGVCQVCQLVMSYVESFIGQNKTISSIEAELDQLCAILPSPLSGICTSVVNQYLPQMVQWLLNKESPSSFCSQVGLCSSKVELKPKMPRKQLSRM